MKSRILLGIAMSVVGLAACGSDDPVTVQSTTYVSTMAGTNEIPPVTTTATGKATYVLTGRTIAYTIQVTGGALVANASLAHIHLGEATVASGKVIFPFTPNAVTTGVIATGTINLDLPIVNGTTSTMSGDSLLVLFNSGKAYTNVHTTTNGGGEIRGQIIRQ